MIPVATKRRVWRRAGFRCEYCHLHQSASLRILFHIEHILPRKHGGKSSIENLALACSYCNLHKGTDLTGIDPVTKRITRLFQPRQDDWSDHFTVVQHRLVSKTGVGRTTIEVLKMNHRRRITLRRVAR